MANPETVVHVEIECSQRSVSDEDNKSETTAVRHKRTKRSISAVWPKMREILHAYRSFMPNWCTSIFKVSCLLSVSVDPLFLYIPIINQDMNCLTMDQNLKTVTLLLRVAVDLPYIVNIISQVLTARKLWRTRSQILDAGTRPLWRVKLAHDLKIYKIILILNDILAILPIPQVVVLVFLATTKASKSLNARRFLNSLIIFQYLPRIYRMYLSCKISKEQAANQARYGEHRICLRVYKFILASHVLGAFWYFFSIQREIDCWQSACQSERKCEANTFECGGNPTFKNVTFLNDLCPIRIPNPAVFDFGIFLDALQSDILRSTDFPQKFLHCTWWGLRSLSSFGQNLEPSTYSWENLFTLGISVVGMILFLVYLNAILQFAYTTSERQKRESISNEVELWLARKGLPRYFKEALMQTFDQKLAEKKVDVEVDDIVSRLPLVYRKYIERHLRLAILVRAPPLQSLESLLLKAMCECLRSVDYYENICIIREGDRLDKMLFITEGTVQSYRSKPSNRMSTSNMMSTTKFDSKILQRGDSYGVEELLNWASKFSLYEDLPTSTRTVKPILKVNAFSLGADDLRSISIKYWWTFTKNKDLSEFDITLLEEFAVSSIEKEIRRRRLRRQARKKQSIKSLRKLDTGSLSQKLQMIISKVMTGRLPSPVGDLAGK